MIISYLKTV